MDICCTDNCGCSYNCNCNCGWNKKVKVYCECNFESSKCESCIKEENSYDFGIQCEISSEGSDDIKVNISKYVNYVNL